MDFLYNFWLVAVLVLLCAVAVYFLFIRKKLCIAKAKLRKDPLGYWRYHQDTVFEAKEAWGIQTSVMSTCSCVTDRCESKSTCDTQKSVALIEFSGDIKAKQRQYLSQAIDEVLINKESFKEVVVKVDSPGGAVPQYGHAFAEMVRLRESGLKLVVCIDIVAASGGYLMSLPANHIVAAPFALVGSIGVVAFVPNLRGLLTNFNITPRTFTAGKYKRTVTLTDNATSEEVERFQSQLESIHRMFSAAVAKYRPHAKLDEVSTGEHWTAEESISLDLGLVDEVATSSKYLFQKNELFRLVTIKHKKKFMEDSILLSLFSRLLQLHI